MLKLNVMNRYLIFFKFNYLESEEERERLSKTTKEAFDGTNTKPICFFGDGDIKIFDQETGDIIEV